jgi:hypothetical protein
MAQDSKLSYQEMDAILKRSVELQVRRGSTTFSEQDVLDAARELGVDAQTAAEVVGAHLARRPTAGELVPRPFNTRLRLEVSPDTFSLTIPPLPLSLGFLRSVAFAGGWLAFIAYLTSRMAESEALFAVFMAALWLSGLGLLRRLVLLVIRKTRLTLNRERGELASTLQRRRPLLTSELRVRTEADDTGDDDSEDDDAKTRRKATALFLEHGIDTIRLLQGYSRQEQRWIESELRAWLQNV